MVNREIARAMAKGDSSDTSPLEDPLGPLWYRGLLGRDLDAEATRLSIPRTKHLSPIAEIDTVLAADKMRGLFSIMFGASTLLVIQRTMAKSEGPAKVHYARMITLLLLGYAQLTEPAIPAAVAELAAAIRAVS